MNATLHNQKLTLTVHGTDGEPSTVFEGIAEVVSIEHTEDAFLVRNERGLGVEHERMSIDVWRMHVQATVEAVPDRTNDVTIAEALTAVDGAAKVHAMLDGLGVQDGGLLYRVEKYIHSKEGRKAK